MEHLESDDEELFSDEEGTFNKVDPDSVVKRSKFVGEQTFKKHLRNFYVKNKHDFRFSKSGSYRIRVRCSQWRVMKCPFFIYGRVLKGEGNTFTLRGFNLKDNCIGDPEGRNKCANPEFMADWYKERLKSLWNDTKLPQPHDLSKEFNKCLKVNILCHRSWKARHMVLERLYGSYEDSYKQVPEFCEMVKRKYEGSVATFSYGTKDATFMSMKICFKTVVEGWKAGSRPIIGLNGCHLTGKFGGVLLSTTTLDGQNGLVPLGIMVSKNETITNWKIFLGDLKPLIEDHNLPPTFISDKQNGILEAVDHHFPLDEHIYCFRSTSRGLACRIIYGMPQSATRKDILSAQDKLEMIKPPFNIRKTWRPRGKMIRSYDEAPSEKNTRTCKRCGQPGRYQKSYVG